jgi:hypothetical protein
LLPRFDLATAGRLCRVLVAAPKLSSWCHRVHRIPHLASDAVRNGTDPLLIDLASRECINVECLCGRVVQIAVYQLIGRNGITGAARAWSLRERLRCLKRKRRPPRRMWIEKWRN